MPPNTVPSDLPHGSTFGAEGRSSNGLVTLKVKQPDIAILRRLCPAIGPVLSAYLGRKLRQAFADYSDMVTYAPAITLADDDSKDEDGLQELRKRFRVIFLRARPNLFRAVSHLSEGLGGPRYLQKCLLECVNAGVGISDRYWANGLGHVKAKVKVESPPKGAQFHHFGQLPVELRLMIWSFAVPIQNRVVRTRNLRKIKEAPCPPLFLVCLESFHHTRRFYKKVTRRGDLLHGKVIPAHYPQRAPLVSFETDLIDIGHWDKWASRGDELPAPEDVRLRRKNGEPLRPIHRAIEAFSQHGIRRVCIGLTYVPKEFEMLWYKNARKWCTKYEEDGVTKYDDWAWKWASKLEEVWTVDTVVDHIARKKKYNLARVFPPSSMSCICSLCAKVDHLGEEKAGYKKPAPLDYQEHERLFDSVEPTGFWPDDVPYPDGVNMSMAEDRKFDLEFR